MFITKVTKTISKTNKVSKRQKRGWFTKEQMSKSLNWGALLGGVTPLLSSDVMADGIGVSWVNIPKRKRG